MEAPAEAVNTAKWVRAIQELRKNKAEVTEEAAKAIYIRLGGLWRGEPETAIGVPASSKEFITEKIEEQEEVKRPRGKRKKE